MARVIEVTVSPTGEATVQTKGYAGADCLQASKFLEQSLGVTVNDAKTAADYRDDSAEHLAALVEARLHDRPPGPAAPAPAPIPSLLEALRQSVAAAQAPRARREAPAAARAGSKSTPRRPA
jgi:hypothetical protein